MALAAQPCCPTEVIPGMRKSRTGSGVLRRYIRGAASWRNARAVDEGAAPSCEQLFVIHRVAMVG
jgi:hypothetical protein